MKTVRLLNIRMWIAISALLFAVFAVLFDVWHTPARADQTELPPAPVPDAQPKRASFVPTASDLGKKLQPAIVKIIIKKHGVPISVGSGFFASRAGVLVTSRHFMRPLFGDATLTAEFITGEKKTLREFKVVDCQPLKGSDLCALKFAYEPKAHISLADASPEVGEGANVIGHPHGFDFTITTGSITRAVKATEKTRAEIEIQTLLAAGNAGGPVVTDQGRLIGVVAKVSDSHPERHVIVPASEIARILETLEAPLSMADARKKAQDALRAEMRHKANDELDPALGFAARAKPLAGLKGLKEVALKFDTRTLRLTIPDIFDDCTSTQKTRESTMHACYSQNEAAILSVQRFPNRGYEDLLTRNGKRLMTPTPLTAVETLIRDEEWELYAPVLNAAQLKSFHSDPSLAQCQITKQTSYKGSAFSEVPACRFSVTNDTDPGGHSINVWLLKDQYLYAVAMWMSDASMAEYFSRVPILAILTAKWDQPLKSVPAPRVMASAPVPHPDALAGKPLAGYKLELPETISFMGSRPERTGAQLDLYGKKLLMDRFEESVVIAVSMQNKGYLPPDFDDVARKSAARITRALGATMQAKTTEIEGVNLAGRPARLMTSFGHDKKNRDVLILAATIFYDEQTWDVVKVAATKDASETFREFKALLAGFKKK